MSTTNYRDPRAKIAAKKVASDANRIADRLRREAAARAPAMPAPVVIGGPEVSELDKLREIEAGLIAAWRALPRGGD